MMRATVFGVVAALAATGSATAQEATWTAQTAGDVRLAYSVFPDAGVAVIARCQAGALELLLQGVQLAAPEIDGAAQFDEGKIREVRWTRSDDGRYLIADRPGHLMRGLTQASAARLQFGFGERAAGLDLTPPSDAAPLEGVLSACGQPLTSPRDEAEPLRLASDGDEWLRRGRIRAPSLAVRDHVSGWAQVTCLTGVEGRLTDCEVEAEGPAGYGFGRATVASLEESRLQPDTPQGRLVSIRFTTLIE